MLQIRIKPEDEYPRVCHFNIYWHGEHIDEVDCDIDEDEIIFYLMPIIPEYDEKQNQIILPELTMEKQILCFNKLLSIGTQGAEWVCEDNGADQWWETTLTIEQLKPYIIEGWELLNQ